MLGMTTPLPSSPQLVSGDPSGKVSDGFPINNVGNDSDEFEFLMNNVGNEEEEGFYPMSAVMTGSVAPFVFGLVDLGNDWVERVGLPGP